MKRWIALTVVFCLVFSGGALAEVTDDTVFIRNGINLEGCCDSTAYTYAAFSENPEETLDYLGWLSDRLIHYILPHATEKLMQIPVFAQAVENGLISRYSALGLTYNDINQFGAMFTCAYVGPDGESIQTISDPQDSLAYRLLINLAIYGQDLQWDDQQMIALEDTVLHEMMHAFMFDYNRNAMNGTDRTGRSLFALDGNGEYLREEDGGLIHINALPDWFAEGVATSVQAGYALRRRELLDFFGMDLPFEEYEPIIRDRASMMYYLHDAWPDDIFTASLLDRGNAYNLGYVASMYLYSMAAEKMGLEPVHMYGEQPRLDSVALLEGLNEILFALNEGMSLDCIIREISTDSETGLPLYEDTDAFERQCFFGMDEPGLIFWQNMMLDYEEQYLVEGFPISGSVLPGYDTMQEHYLPQEWAEEAPAFTIVAPDSPSSDEEYFALSTVQPSMISLGGGRILSYYPETDSLTQEETEMRDIMYIGDQIQFMVPKDE